MGLASIGTNNRIEPLSGDPLSGFDCNVFLPLKGANQLLWYYADLEKKRCIEQQNDDDGDDGFFSNNNTQHNMIDHDINHCLAYRRFAK